MSLHDINIEALLEIDRAFFMDYMNMILHIKHYSLKLTAIDVFCKENEAREAVARGMWL